MLEHIKLQQHLQQQEVRVAAAPGLLFLLVLEQLAKVLLAVQVMHRLQDMVAEAAVAPEQQVLMAALQVVPVE